MSRLFLKNMAEQEDYNDLPFPWRSGCFEKFSQEKVLFGYQQAALKNAAQALYLFYQEDNDGQVYEGDSWHAQIQRKHRMYKRYKQAGLPDGAFAAPQNQGTSNASRQSFPVEASEFMSPVHFVNRMSFWMATGSGKTLVLVKLIEHIELLKKEGKIPLHPILVLAPTDYALSQIKRSIREFNSSNRMEIQFDHLTEFRGGSRGLAYNNVVRVYFCRADHVSDEQKIRMLRWSDYENRGRWFIFLDEAHKGDREDSKRKAYFALMARNGFLFNFSATFNDADDVYTATAVYNLPDFICNGHGKRILRSASSFQHLTQDEHSNFSDKRKTRIMLESLISLAAARSCACNVQQKAKDDHQISGLYHMPLMLTLVNSVNTDESDMRKFFSALRQIAQVGANQSDFEAAKQRLISDWRSGERMFEEGVREQNYKELENMTIDGMRLHVFGAKQKSAMEFIAGRDGKQVAFKLKTADNPFALIKIGDNTAWVKKFLSGMECATSIEGTDWFSEIESRPSISILMGSRAFFESWDSTRPNIINFINIGNRNARIFVTQSIGRGVRIAPLPGQRKRLHFLLDSICAPKKRAALKSIASQSGPLETLIIYTTNPSAVKIVLKEMLPEGTSKHPYKKIKGLNLTTPPMTLLVPKYKDHPSREDAGHSGLEASERSLRTLTNFLLQTSNSVLAVSHGLSPEQIVRLRSAAQKADVNENGNYGLETVIGMFSQNIRRQMADGVRKIDAEDIIHFDNVEAALPPDMTNILREKIAGDTKDPEQALAHSTGMPEKRGTSGEMFQPSNERPNQFRDVFHGPDSAEIQIRRCARHYYAPMLVGSDRADFIKHIIKIDSEVEFLERLENYLKHNAIPWDEWMFSKIDESLDGVYIPYMRENRPARFFPDFIFWMKRGVKYQIVFVDPKGTKYSSFAPKLDGYSRLFEQSGAPRTFSPKSGEQVSVKVLFYNQRIDGVGYKYRRFWISNIASIFAD